jgi:Domain of unknown function (DUF1839)
MLPVRECPRGFTRVHRTDPILDMMPSATTPETMPALSPHLLHRDERAWPETNAPIDVWIEVLHARGLEPRAALAFTLGLDFEGDQFTFLRVPRADLRVLYGVEVQDLHVWRPLAVHAADQCAAGRVVMTEVDAFFLPDTAGVAYRYEHRTTTIGIAAIDLEGEQIRYFHGRSQHTLGGNDFAGVFRVGPYVADATVLSPSAEIAKLDAMRALGPAALVERATALTRLHLAGAPSANPIARYAERLADDVAWLRDDPRAPSQQYVFATVRQAGGSAGLTSALLEWLAATGGLPVLDAAAAFDRLARSARTAHLKLSRIGRTKHDSDVAADVAVMAAAWDEGMSRLADRFAH